MKAENRRTPSRQKYDVVVIGGGSLGIHTADALNRRNPRARILAITQDKQFGGQTDKSVEQFRQLQGEEPIAWTVNEGIKLNKKVAAEINEPTTINYPYVFVLGKPDEPQTRLTLKDYQTMIADTKKWGYDPQEEILSKEALQERYPFIDGDAVEGAVIIHNAGRIIADRVQQQLMQRSKADKNGKGVEFIAGLKGEKILLDKNGKVCGVQTAHGDIETKKVVFAPGAHIVNLPELVDGVEVRNLVDKFHVTQQELFFASVDNVPGFDRPNVFIISPDGAYVRLSESESVGTYGKQLTDNPQIANPTIDPQPAKITNAEEELPVKIYADLAEVSSLYSEGTLARRPKGQTAGYYTDFKDDQPVVGELRNIPGLIFVAGASHYGVMAGAGLGKIAAKLVFKGWHLRGGRVPKRIIRAIDPNRQITEKRKFAL